MFQFGIIGISVWNWVHDLYYILLLNCELVWSAKRVQCVQ